ncbi:MAG TPA: phosphoribosylanthranilate isomerase [Terriglobales bacterium]|nr:phosphoribosylanthranilate isomerase [Terriglobales bacterium]
MTWTKICGITNLEDALNAADAGADALGFVFHEGSPRKTDPETVRKIIGKLPGRIEKVGVFVNQTEDSICALADEAGLSAVQLHGDSLDPQVADLIVKRRPHLKVIVGISMHHPKPEGYAMMWGHDVVHAFLVDAANSSNYGGTGNTFNWEKSQSNLGVVAGLGRVVVAGGLNPGNVAEAIRILKPWGVDVASGVEISPGKKDPDKVRAFVEAVRETEKKN